VLTFREAPSTSSMPPAASPTPNQLITALQPDEGAGFVFDLWKGAGFRACAADPVDMHFSTTKSFGDRLKRGYVRLRPEKNGAPMRVTPPSTPRR